MPKHICDFFVYWIIICVVSAEWQRAFLPPYFLTSPCLNIFMGSAWQVQNIWLRMSCIWLNHQVVNVSRNSFDVLKFSPGTCTLQGGRDTVVGVVTTLWAGWFGVEPRQGQEMFLCSDRPPVEWVPGFFPRVKQLGCEVSHILTASAEVQNNWSCISMPPVRLCGMYRKNFTFTCPLTVWNLTVLQNTGWEILVHIYQSACNICCQYQSWGTQVLLCQAPWNMKYRQLVFCSEQ